MSDVHTCHAECPCRKGKDPAPDFERESVTDRYREALERLHHLVVSPGDMGREEIRCEGRRVIEEALNG